MKRPRSTAAGIILAMMAPYPTAPGMVLVTTVQGVNHPSVKMSIKSLLPVVLDFRLHEGIVPFDQQSPPKPAPAPVTLSMAYALPGNTRLSRINQRAVDEQPTRDILSPPRQASSFAQKIHTTDNNASKGEGRS